MICWLLSGRYKYAKIISELSLSSLDVLPSCFGREVKYRRKVIDDDISGRLREIFEYICPNYGIELEEWNHDIDHVHVMFKAQPTTELSKFINAYKSASSRLIKKEFPFIKSQLWKEYFWSRSFCLLTSGGAPIEVLRQYIESQGSKSGIAH